jgi:hypothetical protein
MPRAEVEAARAAAESGPCSMRRKWSVAAPRGDRAPASALIRKQAAITAPIFGEFAAKAFSSQLTIAISTFKTVAAVFSRFQRKFHQNFLVASSLSCYSN